MPEVSWIKLTTAMFDDEKIKVIESMPEADTLIVIWIKFQKFRKFHNCKFCPK